MAYGALKEVSATIAEREYCVGDTITTTAITSCIVVVGMVGSKLFGIHLSIFGESDAFGVEDAKAVGEAMRRKGVDMSKVHVFGEIDFWGPAIPGYRQLMTEIGDPPSGRQHQRSGIVTVSKSDVM